MSGSLQEIILHFAFIPSNRHCRVLNTAHFSIKYFAGEENTSLLCYARKKNTPNMERHSSFFFFLLAFINANNISKCVLNFAF